MQHALIFGQTDGKYGVYYIIGWCIRSNLPSLLPHPHSSSYGVSVGHHDCPALGEGQWRLWPQSFLTMTYASEICILQTKCICQFDGELNHTIFTNSAPLGRVGHRVAMSVCLSVCLSAPSGAVFF